ncbi:3,4-dihydroxy-2-butanone-4-phosphate synthase [Limosilactobacillus fermentum]
MIIEVLKSDGQMARRDDLFQFADRLGVPYITIQEILTYMDQHGIKGSARPNGAGRALLSGCGQVCTPFLIKGGAPLC